MFEHKSQRPISKKHFTHRVLKCTAIALLFTAFSLGVGVWGYHIAEDLPWLDSLLNASMILGGMGPVDPMKTAGGKIFASCYALYSGLFLIMSMGIILSPVFHRVLHTFHADDK